MSEPMGITGVYGLTFLLAFAQTNVKEKVIPIIVILRKIEERKEQINAN